MGDGDVTGGQIYTLWRVGNILLEEMADVFIDASHIVGHTSHPGGHTGANGQTNANLESAFDRTVQKRWGETVEPDPVFPHWKALHDELQYILARTGSNTKDATTACNLAIQVYCGTDSNSAKAVTAAGRDFQQNWKNNPDKGGHPPTGDSKPGTPDYPDDYKSPGDQKG